MWMLPIFLTTVFQILLCHLDVLTQHNIVDIDGYDCQFFPFVDIILALMLIWPYISSVHYPVSYDSFSLLDLIHIVTSSTTKLPFALYSEYLFNCFGCSMWMISSMLPFKYVHVTSKYRIFIFCLAAIDISERMEPSLITSENVSLKLMPWALILFL